MKPNPCYVLQHDDTILTGVVVGPMDSIVLVEQEDGGRCRFPRSSVFETYEAAVSAYTDKLTADTYLERRNIQSAQERLVNLEKRIIRAKQVIFDIQNPGVNKNASLRIND
jgi:hypothetical protein